jgi:hypothetical protein
LGKFRSVWLVETIIMVRLMAVSDNATPEE